MSQSLKINDKTYLPSTELAKTFGYTSDYISRLAREEKILATQVNRQWFVEPESLKIFSLQADTEKRLRKEELSRVRKVERLKNTKENSTEDTVIPFEFSALAQATMVLICGLFIGSLSWFAADSGVRLSDLAYGSNAALALLSDAVVPDVSVPTLVKEIFEDKEPSTSSNETIVETFSEVKIGNDSGTYTTLPVFPQREERVVTDNEANIEQLVTNFSDEVQIVTENETEVIIQPIFKNSTGDEASFQLVPHSEVKE